MKKLYHPLGNQEEEDAQLESKHELLPSSSSLLTHALLLLSSSSSSSSSLLKNNSETKTITNDRRRSAGPLNTMIQFMRIARYMPLEMAIGFSGKYGRQAIPLVVQSSARSSSSRGGGGDSSGATLPVAAATSTAAVVPHYYFQHCQRTRLFQQQEQSGGRGRGGPCPTCRYPIPKLGRKPPPPSRNDWSIDDNNNEDVDVEDSFGKKKQIQDYFSIQVTERIQTGGRVISSLDLRDCHPKCFPNLPQELTCPICFGFGLARNDGTQQQQQQQQQQQRQTLVLSDLCYRSESGTEKPESHQMALTFTPAAAAAVGEMTRGTADPNHDDEEDEEGETANSVIVHEESEDRRGGEEEEEDVFLSLPRRPSKRARLDRHRRHERERQNQRFKQQQEQQRRRRGHVPKSQPCGTATSTTLASFNIRRISQRNAAPASVQGDRAMRTKDYEDDGGHCKMGNCFPPRYRDMFIPTLAQPHTSDAKYGMTIYCTACDQFALIAPAGLCDPYNHVESPRLHGGGDAGQPDDDDDDNELDNSEEDDDDDDDPMERRRRRSRNADVAQQQQQQLTIAPPRPHAEPPFVVGGVLQRQTCRSRRHDGNHGQDYAFQRDENHDDTHDDDVDDMDDDRGGSGFCPYTIPCSFCRHRKKRALGFFDKEYACTTCQPFSTHTTTNGTRYYS
ncbi:hypothetical protein ACA910_020316 [Epithemia clementina (nom. ined.)]